MKIGLINVDSPYPKLALMKLSAWHKREGDLVKWWNAFESFDKVYASQIFSASKFQYYPKGVVKGGSGISLEKTLPDTIEHIYPDYDLFKIDYAMGYLTRGCINHCPFCIVPQKEGVLHKHANLEEFWHGQTHLRLLDNALTDYQMAAFELGQIRDKKIILDLWQGFNLRTLTREIAEILAEIHPWKQWRFAWDWIKDEAKIRQGIQLLNDVGIKAWRCMCYVLVGYNSTIEEDLYRIQILEELGVDPFVMCYQKTPLLRKLAKWSNRPQLRHTCSFFEYIKT